MNNIHEIKVINPRNLAEIQAQRKLEGEGDIKEQLAYVLKVQESNKDVTAEATAELTTMMSTIMAMEEQKINAVVAELTTAMAQMMGGTNV